MQYLGGNRLTLLHNGVEYFPALAAAIDAAKREVFLESQPVRRPCRGPKRLWPN